MVLKHDGAALDAVVFGFLSFESLRPQISELVGQFQFPIVLYCFHHEGAGKPSTLYLDVAGRLRCFQNTGGCFPRNTNMCSMYPPEAFTYQL